MANDREEAKQPANQENEQIRDLDVDELESDKVKGGRRMAEDPCAGGE